MTDEIMAVRVGEVGRSVGEGEEVDGVSFLLHAANCAFCPIEFDSSLCVLKTVKSPIFLNRVNPREGIQEIIGSA